MPRSTKIVAGYSLGDTIEQKNERTKRLRKIAYDAGYKGRYGGNTSALLCAIADLPEDKRRAIAIILKEFLQTS